MTTPILHSREPLARLVIAISGASGMIGRAAARTLQQRGHEVKRLVRRPAADAGEISWDPTRGTIDIAGLGGVDVVLHLGGETLAQRWTAGARARILESRTNSTLLLARTMGSMARRPPVLLSASAVGIYGSRGDEILDESSAAGDGFLADVCKQWESATAPAAAAGVRVVCFRMGVVVSPRGGMLAKLLPVFRGGIGGRIGDGRQWLSWIALTDCVEAILLLAGNANAHGVVNLVSPNPVTNAEFTRILAHVVRRPGFMTVPGAALRLALGEMARETVLASQRVVPRRLLEWGFEFSAPTLESALRQELAAGAVTRSAH